MTTLCDVLLPAVQNMMTPPRRAAGVATVREANMEAGMVHNWLTLCLVGTPDDKSSG